MSKAGEKPKICIVGGGNAAHALAALLPFKGYETSMYCSFRDEADRMKAGIDAQGGYMLANFASHNKPAGAVKGTPSLISKDPSEVIPGADVLIMPLPSFAYPGILKEIKDYLREGQIMCVTPGQGAFDWYAREILGDDLMDKIVVMGLMPMPFNCRIEEFGKVVNVQELKRNYTIGVSPIGALPKCQKLIEDIFGSVEPAGHGSFLECTMYPINAVIHPARLRTLLMSWKPGDVLPENPLFYEEFTAEAAKMMDDINKDLIVVGKALTKQGVPASIPHIFDWLAVYVYNEDKDSNLQKFFQTNDAYKGFRCPLIPAEDGKEGFVPDFTNRYFTEDINCGLCGYKGLADIAGVETPTIDSIIEWAQSHMGVEFMVDGKLVGKDVGITNAPQRFGIKTIEDLRKLYPKQPEVKAPQ